ncbi:siderophore-interacting protein [Nocardia sp. NPDC050712]|uniref:siderophore-interacting protein n=1 Tax=Nocardia sp. NPDC050712 TaxID=3155518 RepID=UPI0033D91655
MTVSTHVERIAEVRAGSGGEKVPYPIGLRELEVLRTRMVGSALLRLTFGGPELAGFESHAPTEHIRLIFPDADGSLRLPEKVGLSMKWPRPLPISREYTVRRFDAGAGELDIDFALHPGGFAAGWAAAVTPGTRVYIAGPPGGLVVPDTYDRYLLAGDITALPAIARWLEALPANAGGWAFLEVADASEVIDIAAPPGVQVHWLYRDGVAAGHSEVLVRAVQALTPPVGERVYAWVAGEAVTVRPLRRWLRADFGLDPADHSVTGYWKRGVADFEEAHEH